MAETPREAEAPLAPAAPVPRASAPPAGKPRPGAAPGPAWDAGNAVTWLRGHPVLAAGIALIAASAWWKSALLGKSYFRADDFFYLENAARQGLGWGYLTWVDAGHLTIIGSALAWLVARAFPLDWTLASAVTLILYAAASLAALRMLRTLFGDRPGVLVLLALYLLSPLSLPGLSWWTVANEQLPLQLAIFCAVTAHVRYLREHRARHAAVAAAWLAVAMLSTFQGAALALLLYALTTAFYTPGRWSRALWPALRAHWPAWTAYAVLIAAYTPLYLAKLASSTAGAAKPATFSYVLTYAGTLLRDTFVPGALGGPWRWAFTGVAAWAAPPHALAWLAWITAALVVIISLIYAWRAARAWVILAGWLLVVDIIPVLAGRSTLFPAAALGLSARYAWDATAILILCLGLAFLPLQGGAGPARRPRLLSRTELAAVTTVLAAVAFGSVWSFYSYPADPSAAAARGYVATARAALAAAPAGTSIVDDRLPDYVAGGPLFGSYADASDLLTPLESADPAHQATFITQPQGTVDNLMEFNFWGQLAPATVVGTASRALPAGASCWPSGGQSVVVSLTATPASPAIVDVAYISGQDGAVQVSFGGVSRQLRVSKGLHNMYLPVSGTTGSQVIIQAVSGTIPCVGSAAAGALFPAASGTLIPAATVAG